MDVWLRIEIDGGMGIGMNVGMGTGIDVEDGNRNECSMLGPELGWMLVSDSLDGC